MSQDLAEKSSSANTALKVYRWRTSNATTNTKTAVDLLLKGRTGMLLIISWDGCARARYQERDGIGTRAIALPSLGDT